VCGGRDEPACADAGAPCTGDGVCCSGYCEDNAYLPSWRTCVAPEPDGAFCTRDAQCQSGRCIDYTCGGVQPEPEPEPTCGGASCFTDADCCSGSFCENTTYAAWVCTTTLPAGSFCVEDRQCTSGRCVDYACQ
jgi:hypothetical protein